jgi:hypothetical protein
MYGIWKTASLAVLLAASAVAQKTANENQVRDRGQTRVADESQTLDRGRIGTQDAVPNQPITFTGTLVDAGCRDRSPFNLRQAPHLSPAAGAAPGTAIREDQAESREGRASKGITVDAKTLDAERADIMNHQVPDLRTRQADLACAITGATRAFAIVMENGRLVDLDEGGNTRALQAVQSNPEGRAMLNGNGPGVKPRVMVTARLHGDRAVIDRLRIQ